MLCMRRAAGPAGAQVRKGATALAKQARAAEQASQPPVNPPTSGPTHRHYAVGCQRCCAAAAGRAELHSSCRHADAANAGTNSAQTCFKSAAQRSAKVSILHIVALQRPRGAGLRQRSMQRHVRDCGCWDGQRAPAPNTLRRQQQHWQGIAIPRKSPTCPKGW